MKKIPTDSQMADYWRAEYFRAVAALKERDALIRQLMGIGPFDPSPPIPDTIKPVPGGGEQKR